MPDGITLAGVPATFTEANHGWTIKDFSGKDKSVSVKVRDGAPAAADIDALRVAIGNGTNGVIIEQRSTAKQFVDPKGAAITTYDDAYAGVNAVAVFVFQDFGAKYIERIEVPAPDASLFLADGETIDATQAESAAIIAAALTVLNGGANEFSFVRGFLSGRAQRASKPRVLPGNVEEPNAVDGDLPEEGPGELPPAV